MKNLQRLAVLIVFLMLVQVKVSTAVTCTPTELSPCYQAIVSGQKPTEGCCSKLREQRPCLCGYIRDPNLKQYVNSPNARKVAGNCGVAIPRCS